MKSIVLFAGLFCAFCLFHTTKAAPTDAAALEPNINELAVEERVESDLNRQKRATCDLLSGLGFQHSACAGHCLLRGNRGGYCNGRGVCVCRN